MSVRASKSTCSIHLFQSFRVVKECRERRVRITRAAILQSSHCEHVKYISLFYSFIRRLCYCCFGLSRMIFFTHVQLSARAHKPIHAHSRWQCVQLKQKRNHFFSCVLYQMVLYKEIFPIGSVCQEPLKMAIQFMSKISVNFINNQQSQKKIVRMKNE